MVKRAMNRAPSPRDYWWSKHQQSCGGTYLKVKEPENYGKQKSTKKSKDVKKNSEKSMNIKDMFKKNDTSANKTGAGVSVSDVKPFVGTGHRLGEPKNQVPAVVIDDRLNMREKMLLAVEKRQSEAQKHSSVAKKRPRTDQRDISPSHSTSYRKKATTTASEDVRKYYKDACKSGGKKIKLERDSPVIILDSPDSPKLQLNPTVSSPSIPVSQQELEQDIVIDISKEAAGPSSALLVHDAESQDSVGGEIIALDDTTMDYDSAGVHSEGEVVEVNSGADAPTMSSPGRTRGELEFRTCPVCGMSNIPKAVINTHIAFCIDAEEESQFVDEDGL